MSEADLAAVEDALATNPAEIAAAEEHLRKGLMILSEQIGLGATRGVVEAILLRLEGGMPERRTH